VEVGQTLCEHVVAIPESEVAERPKFFLEEKNAESLDADKWLLGGGKVVLCKPPC